MILRMQAPGRGEVGLRAAGALAALLRAEGAVRVRGEGDPRTGYAPVNTKRRPGPTNAEGYRDEERRLAKPLGTRRVVALGDSFSWGTRVEFEDAWPQRLERGLGRQRGESWAVINLAPPRMNTVEQAERPR